MRIISLALWCHNKHASVFERYFIGLPVIIRAYKALYPGYQLRIYHDDSIHNLFYWSSLQSLARNKVIDLQQLPRFTTSWSAALNRMRPLWESNCDLLLCRDIDSLPTTIERGCVDDFVSGDYIAHSISDHVYHETPIMAGLCGFKSRLVASLLGVNSYEEFIAKNQTTLDRGNIPIDRVVSMHDPEFMAQGINCLDTDILRHFIWPKVSSQALIHNLANKEWSFGEKKQLTMNIRSVADHKLSSIPFKELTAHLGAPGFNYHRAYGYLNSVINLNRFENAQEMRSHGY